MSCILVSNITIFYFLLLFELYISRSNIILFILTLLNNHYCSLVILGWILVAGTFILCGIFLLLHK